MRIFTVQSTTTGRDAPEGIPIDSINKASVSKAKKFHPEASNEKVSSCFPYKYLENVSVGHSLKSFSVLNQPSSDLNRSTNMAGIVELLPKEYGYIILTIITYCFVNLYMQIQVGKARKK
ncbi:hypothetical protein L2E82_34176 [Cichorium intybus]|uniref:Uncharacterized protein n=1 Tax=Cichorium intybus TaxID=13427 RepID=A0ACB9BLZ6_CICIN|nr:hypothetical protein L2E82_34176 [Cichorium intybus]